MAVVNRYRDGFTQCILKARFIGRWHRFCDAIVGFPGIALIRIGVCRVSGDESREVTSDACSGYTLGVKPIGSMDGALPEKSSLIPFIPFRLIA